jgi:predicted SprT family Zn-dependent metalloprotease
MRTARGRVRYVTGSPVVELNPHLYARCSDWEQEKNAKHEAAHVIVWHQLGGKCGKHGREWRVVMVALGVPVERCHSVDTTGLKRRQRRWRVTCSRCGGPFGVMSTQRLNKLRRAISLRAACCGNIRPNDLQYVRIS